MKKGLRLDGFLRIPSVALVENALMKKGLRLWKLWVGQTASSLVENALMKKGLRLLILLC